MAADSYSIEPIGARTAASAFPLARVLRPSLTSEEWRLFCLAAEARGASPEASGDHERITVVSNPGGYVKAMCFHTVREQSRFGRLLDVPLVIVASATDAEGVAGELFSFLQRERDRVGCAGIRFWPFDERNWERRFDPEDAGVDDGGLVLPASSAIDRRSIIDRFFR